MTVRGAAAASLLLVIARAAWAGEEPVYDAGEKQPRLEVDGRVFVRETLADDGDGEWRAQTSVASARVGLRYRRDGLRARLRVELRKSARLREAYLDLSPLDGLSVRAGHFKLPLSPLEMSSAWRLPVADRGLVSTILRDRLQVAGFRAGAQVSWAREGERWPIAARAGYFQGLDDLGELLEATAEDGFGKVVAGRLEVGPFGATGQLRQGRADLLAPVRTAWAASADATLEAAGLRVWLEATLGSSWIVAEPTRDRARFLEARAVAGWRLGGARGGALYVEPYVLAGLVDPDAEIADDLVVEASGGVNLGAWKRWRLQAEVEVWRFGDNVPLGFVAAATAALARTAIVTQLGASF